MYFTSKVKAEAFPLEVIFQPLKRRSCQRAVNCCGKLNLTNGTCAVGIVRTDSRPIFQFLSDSVLKPSSAVPNKATGAGG